MSTQSGSYLLDTNILIHLIRGNDCGERVAEHFGLWEVVAQISIVSVGETLSLARRFGWGKRKIEWMNSLLEDFGALDIRDSQVLELYAELDSYSMKIGRRMGKNDVWIAATAKAHSLLLLTTDLDFEHLVPGHIDRILVDVGTGLPHGTNGT